MGTRITETDVHIQVVALSRILNRNAEHRVTVNIILGSNGSYKTTNKLMIGMTNVWPDAMAGHTKREAWNALRLMISALSILDD